MHMRIHAHAKAVKKIASPDSDCFRRARARSRCRCRAANLQQTAFGGNQSGGRVFLFLKLHYKQEILRHD